MSALLRYLILVPRTGARIRGRVLTALLPLPRVLANAGPHGRAWPRQLPPPRRPADRNQFRRRAAIDWRSFSIGPGEVIAISQPAPAMS